MNTKNKIELALQFLDRHEKVFGQKIPQRLREFWSNGEAEKFENTYTEFLKTPNGLDGIFQVLLAIPSWEIQGNDGGIDISVVGPDGEWTNAKKFIPLFHAEQDRFFVVRIDRPECPVGYFEEEIFEWNDSGCKSGVYLLKKYKSFDEFLSSLSKSPSKNGEVMECTHPKSIQENWIESPRWLKEWEEEDSNEESEEGD